MAKYKNIFKAIEANDIEAVKTFLPEQLELRNEDGSTPLHNICVWGRTEIARLLLDYGADIEAGDIHGETPLHKACQHDRTEIAYLLLDRGANINARDKDNYTPLHYACGLASQETSEFLVIRGADPFVKDNLGKSALDYDYKIVRDKDGKEVQHRQILVRLRAEYLNKPVMDKTERTAALSSGWEMEM